MKYLDLDLSIERSGDGYTARVFNSPGGQASVEFALPFSDLEVENFLLRVGRTRHAVRRIESPEMASAKLFGGRLFNAVFAGDVRGCLRSSLDEASRQGVGLRVRLHLTKAPEIADLPWEYLYNPGMNRFLGLSVDTPLVRYLELPERIRPLTIKPPLRVLMMISSPTDYPRLDVARETAKMSEALADLEARGLVSVDRIEDATLAELQRRLRQGEYHIFHFVGHGGFDEASEDGVLVLEDPEERGRKVSAQFLGTLLHDHRPLRLAILNACEGARSSRADPFGGTAQSLVQQGIPAVIGMQFEVTDEAAICFTREFYAAIAGGYPVDAALAEARKAIFAGVSEIEWGTPVLYMRSPDGHIFDVEQVSAAEGQQIKIASLLAAARDAEAAGDDGAALDRVDQALAIDPNHAEAAARRRDISRRRELATHYASGRAAYDEGRWQEAADVLRRVVATDREYRDAGALIALAEQALARAASDDARRSRAEDLRRAAASAASSEQWDIAIERWQELVALDPNDGQARDKLSDARRQQGLAERYARARAHYERRHWREALVELQQIQQAAPGYKDVTLLVTGIERELSRVPTGDTGAAFRGTGDGGLGTGPSRGTGVGGLGTGGSRQTGVGGLGTRRPAPQPAPPRGRATWFVGGLVGGAVAVVGLIVVVAIVVAGLVAPDTTDDASDFDPFNTIDSGFDDAAVDPGPAPPSLPDPGPAPAPAPPPPSRAQMTPAMQAELRAAINRGDQAEILAYRTLNPGALSEVYTGNLLNRHMQELQALAATGMVAENVLANQEFHDFRLSADGQQAEVDFTERWSTNFLNPLTEQCVVHIHEHNVPQTAYLQRMGGRWIVYDVNQPPSTPVLVTCH